MGDEAFNQISDTMIRIINHYVECEKKPRQYGTEDLLFPSEVHMVSLIGNNEGCGVSELATISGVTKGAVSQVIKKLEMRGLTQKSEDKENKTRTVIKLTNKGRVVYYAHEMHHEYMGSGFKEYIKSLDAEKLNTIKEFLNYLDKSFEYLLRKADK